MKLKWVWTGLIGLGFVMALFLLGCSQEAQAPKKPENDRKKMEKTESKPKKSVTKDEIKKPERANTNFGPNSVVAKKRTFSEDAPKKGTDTKEGIPVGSKAVMFQASTYDDQKLNLGDYEGRLILLDFWATWCKPCHREFPVLKKIHDEFGSNNNFAIIGVSLDKDAADVAKFVRKYELNYPHVFDGKMWDNSVSQLYGIHRIPYTVVIGPEGTVIATELRGTALYEFIAKQLAD